MFVSFVFAASSTGITTLTNQLRQQNGRTALKENSYLNSVSSAYAQTITATGVLGHDQAGESFAQRLSKLGLSSCAENLAENTSGNDNSIVQQWYKSAGHRENMLGKYEFIGIGINGKNYVQLLCQSVPGTTPNMAKSPPVIPGALESKDASMPVSNNISTQAKSVSIPGYSLSEIPSTFMKFLSKQLQNAAPLYSTPKSDYDLESPTPSVQDGTSVETATEKAAQTTSTTIPAYQSNSMMHTFAGYLLVSNFH